MVPKVQWKNWAVLARTKHGAGPIMDFSNWHNNIFNYMSWFVRCLRSFLVTIMVVVHRLVWVHKSCCRDFSAIIAKVSIFATYTVQNVVRMLYRCWICKKCFSSVWLSNCYATYINKLCMQFYCSLMPTFYFCTSYIRFACVVAKNAISSAINMKHARLAFTTITKRI